VEEVRQLEAVLSTSLSAEQAARVEALKSAREVMAVRPNLFAGNHPAGDVDDIIHMARYILKGKRDWRDKDVRPDLEDDDETPTDTGG